MRISEAIGRSEPEIYNTLKADEFVNRSITDGLILNESFCTRSCKQLGVMLNLHLYALSVMAMAASDVCYRIGLWCAEDFFLSAYRRLNVTTIIQLWSTLTKETGTTLLN